jgi:hypothetical protein
MVDIPVKCSNDNEKFQKFTGSGSRTILNQIMDTAIKNSNNFNFNFRNYDWDIDTITKLLPNYLQFNAINKNFNLFPLQKYVLNIVYIFEGMYAYGNLQIHNSIFKKSHKKSFTITNDNLMILQFIRIFDKNEAQIAFAIVYSIFNNSKNKFHNCPISCIINIFAKHLNPDFSQRYESILECLFENFEELQSILTNHLSMIEYPLGTSEFFADMEYNLSRTNDKNFEKIFNQTRRNENYFIRIIEKNG